MRDTRRPRWLLRATAVAAAVAVVLGVLALVTGTAALGVLALVVAAVVLAGSAWLMHRQVPDPPAERRPVADSTPTREVDDLRDFFEHPPGSPPALTAAQPAPSSAGSGSSAAGSPGEPTGPPARASAPAGSATTATVPDRDPGRAGRSTRPAVLGLATASVLLLVLALGLAAIGGRDRPTAPAAGGATTNPAAARPPTTSAAVLTAGAAGDLADTDLAPADDGFTARLAFAGIVLERRAVGVTVTYPRLTLSSDGTQSIAHLEAPTWNCLSAEPPADPAVADCTRSLTEYADLPSPDLDVTLTGGQLRLTGSFPTYTRPNGSAAVYTGRAYALTVEVSTQRPVTGSLRLGDAESATTDDTTDNQVNDRGRPGPRTG